MADPTTLARRPSADLRLRLAVLGGRAARLASRLARRGSGISIQGQVIVRMDPDALGKLLRDRTIAAVTGTNGKTTTTHLLTAAVRAGLGADSERLVTNADGANLHHGLASALSTAPRADMAVLETDERVVADVVSLGRPAVLVLLNFSRDQLDRHHEITALGRSWRTALGDAGADGPVVVANADDPLIVWAARTARQVVWVSPSAAWVQDATLCPECGEVLAREDGRWHCTGCDLAQPEATYRVDFDGDTGDGSKGTILDPAGTRHRPGLRVPGRFNVGNAAFALAAAAELGVDASTALAGMRTVSAPAGRFGSVRFGTTRARLVLAKNPAGWAEALPLAATDPVVLAIDSAAADGRDVSWLWDVDFEQLAGRTVIATGPRAQDLAVRLEYAEVEHRTVPDLASAVAGHEQPVDVVATYTPFQRLRRLADPEQHQERAR